MSGSSERTHVAESDTRGTKTRRNPWCGRSFALASHFGAGKTLFLAQWLAETPIRSSEIGFVFQTFDLIASLTAWENVALPAELAGVGTARQRREHAYSTAGYGWPQRAGHAPAKRTVRRTAPAGGHRPSADEQAQAAFGGRAHRHLDSATGAAIAILPKRLNAARQTLILVTHNPEVAIQSRSAYWMRDGVLRRVVAGEFFAANWASAAPVPGREAQPSGGSALRRGKAWSRGDCTDVAREETEKIVDGYIVLLENTQIPCGSGCSF